MFISNFIILSWLGQQNVSNYVEVAGQICTMYYFLFFVIAIPLVGRFEEALLMYELPEDLEEVPSEPAPAALLTPLSTVPPVVDLGKE